MPKTTRFWPKGEPERRVQNALGTPCPRRSYGSGEGDYLRRRLRRFGAAAGAAAAAAFLRRLRRFGAAGAAFFAFFRAAMVHPLVDESVRRGRYRARTLSPFVRAVKGMFRQSSSARSSFSSFASLARLSTGMTA